MEEDNDDKFEKEKLLTFEHKVSNEAKLKELLRNLTSTELKLCSDASKEFIKLLGGDSGRELLIEYIQTSYKCSELVQAWEIRQGNLGLSCIVSLISAILSHPDGKYMDNDRVDIGIISRALDKFARVIVEEKLGDIYKELSSKEAKRQNAALCLLSSVVRRGSGLASDVAKSFDFKLPIFPKLAECKRKEVEVKRKHSTRKSFVGFAMSFLEVGKPGLLRWVLQQKEMYSGVLRGLGNDDDEMVGHVLSTLCDRVLIPESLVPPGLRSVLFGSVTLDQLISISGRENGGIAAEIAHKILVRVCTDPANGLIPDLKRHPNPLRGNTKRLLDLMKKLKATEVDYHRDLLLDIVSGRPSFGSAYLDEFPYGLEDLSSPSWSAAVSLAAKLVSAVGTCLPFCFLDSQAQKPPIINSSDVRSIIKCICPHPFTRLIINKGLLHSDFRVKHGTLRFVLEALKLLDSLIGALNNSSCCSNKMMHGLASLKQDIQNEVRISLPDPQIFLSLLASLNTHYKSRGSRLKREADSEIILQHNTNGVKKLRTCMVNNEPDILVSGISSFPDIALPKDSGVANDGDELDNGDDRAKVIAEIWGLHQSSMFGMALEDAQTYFYSKLLDTLKIYQRIMPDVLGGSFDFFKVLPCQPLALPTILQQSLLSLLVEHIGWSSKCAIPTRIQPIMYKHLHTFINLLIYSSVKDVKDQAYILAQAAMLSTGAFDKNLWEIGAWFLFIPGYAGDKFSVEDQEVEVSKFFSSVVSFLCDAVSTTGNNLFKYWELLRHHIYHLKGVKDISPDFSPLVICMLEKCLRLLSSESRTFTLPEKSMVSLYVCNTLKYLLQTQVDVGLLSSLISLLLSERLEDRCSIVDISGDLCEWRPLKNLLLFSESVAKLQSCNISSADMKLVGARNSFVHTLNEVERVLRSEHGEGEGLAEISTAFSFSILCTTPAEIVENFPPVISISQHLLGAPFSLLLSIFSLEQNLLNGVFKSWPEMFFGGMERALTMTHNSKGGNTEIIGNTNINSIGSASVAFSLFLKQAPFCVLFPAFISMGGPFLLEHPKFQNLLILKVSEGTIEHFITSFRLVLFWIHQIHSSYRIEPLDELEQLSEVCFSLLQHMLPQLLDKKRDFDSLAVNWTLLSTQCVQEVAEIIFCHPAVTVSLECPLHGSEKFADEIFGQSGEKFLALASQGVHKMDHHVLNMLATTSEHLLALCNGQEFLSQVGCGNRRTVKAFKALEQKLFLIFRDRFDQCINAKDFVPLMPTLIAFHTLIRFISPFKLLELVNWIFSRVDLNDSTDWISSKSSALSVGLCIASCAFDLLSVYVHQPSTKQTPFEFFWGIEENFFDVSCFERVYSQVCEIATCYELNAADLCLLKAVNVASIHKVVQNQSLPSCMILSRVITSTPTKLLSHCIHRTSMTKAKLLFCLTEMSSFHQSVFGNLFLDMMNRSMVATNNQMKTCKQTPSDEDFMILLPTAVSYLKSTFLKFGEPFFKHFKDVPSFYWRILSCCFSRKSYVSGDIFQVECCELLPLSVEELLILVYNSRLGKAILMLQYFFSLSGCSVKLKERLRLFDSVFPCSSSYDDLLEDDASDINACSPIRSLNFIIRTVVKIQFCRMLLYPNDTHIHFLPRERDGDKKEKQEVPLEVGSNKETLSRIRFISVLVGMWQFIVDKFPSNSKDSRHAGATKSSLFRLLEVFVLRNIVELTAELRDCLVKLHSLPYIEQLARSTLLHRFEDPTTLEMLRSVVTLLSEGKFPHVVVLQLLLAHSQFTPSVYSASKSFGFSQFGMIFRPISSILRSLIVTNTEQNAPHRKNHLQRSELYMQQLEIVKLLRVLFRFGGQQCSLDSEKEIGINCRELLFLLFSSYSATLSEMDLEIYNLMHEIETADESNAGGIAEMDFLWGSAAIKVRKEREKEQDTSSDKMNDVETAKERRRNQFRENLPIDPKLCANTVLYFPYYRTLDKGTPSLNRPHQDNSDHMVEARYAKAPTANNEEIQIYDPAFILRLSIHSLSMGYIDPMESASLGLLAVTFVSMSSPDVEMRKMGYDALGRFKTALEKCQKRKDVIRLRLLLTYLQNGIGEPWQRIPSIIAIFVAETSLILLDPSHDHYSFMSKFLMRSPKANMKCIPLFQNFFWSSSVNFKKDRWWILRLLCVALNSDDDAQICIRNSIFEIVLSFYASPLSDNESKELILQVVKKSIKLHKLSRYLVEHCGLISWLSSVVSFFCEKLYQDQMIISFTQLTMVLGVVHDVISSGNAIEWLQKYALEQLTELSSRLYKLLVGDIKLIKENIPLVNSILQILASSLRISQKRKIYQPHFTLSIEGLFQIYEAVDACSNGVYCPTMDYGLKAVLMSSPPEAILYVNREKLLKFLRWAISSALHATSTKVHQAKESYRHSTIFFDEEESEDSMISKLLRWLTASIIRGRVSKKFNDCDSVRLPERSNLQKLQSLLEHSENGFGENQALFGSEDILAAAIFYLQQYIGINCRVLPSVVAALSLVFPATSISEADNHLCHGNHLTLLWSRIRCPAEANPAWRWSFYQPWKDLSFEQTDAEKMDEIHACQSLLVVISNVLGKKSLHSQFLSYHDVESSGVFQWEKSMLQT